MKRIFAFTAIILLIVTTACPFKKKDGAQVKPSELVTLAKVSAVLPVGLDTLSAIVLIRTHYGANKSDAWVLISNLEQVLTKLDYAREQFASGKWDEANTREFLQTAAKEFKAAVADGTLGVKNETTKAEWTAWATTIAAAIESAYELSDALKPLPETIQQHEGQRVRESINPTEVSEIVAVSIPASIKVIGIYRQTDAATLWEKAKTESERCHENNRQRLAELKQ